MDVSSGEETESEKIFITLHIQKYINYLPGTNRETFRGDFSAPLCSIERETSPFEASSTYLRVVNLSQNSQSVECGLAYSAPLVHDHRRHPAGHHIQIELRARERYQREDQQLQRVLSRLRERIMDGNLTWVDGGDAPSPNPPHSLTGETSVLIRELQGPNRSRLE